MTKYSVKERKKLFEAIALQKFYIDTKKVYTYFKFVLRFYSLIKK